MVDPLSVVAETLCSISPDFAAQLEAERVENEVVKAWLEILGDYAGQAALDRGDAERLCERLDMLITRRRTLVRAADKALARHALLPSMSEGARSAGDVVRDLAAFDRELLEFIIPGELDKLLAKYSDLDVDTWTANGELLSQEERCSRDVRAAIPLLTEYIRTLKKGADLDPLKVKAMACMVARGVLSYWCHADVDGQSGHRKEHIRDAPVASDSNPEQALAEWTARINGVVGSKEARKALGARAVKHKVGQAIVAFADMCKCGPATIDGVINPERKQARAENAKKKRGKRAKTRSQTRVRVRHLRKKRAKQSRV